jgi:transketolase
MRKQLCDALVARATKPELVFLTGDLGFMALEALQQALGPRFINAGVAEQNMVSVAAGLARQNLEVWVYSIAPFCYARPFEQIRNDITFHNLPVKLIGNGGGYGYGVMGPTHHAIEDYGVLLTLPNMSVYVPVFDEDMDAVITRAGNSSHPAYIRMGRGEPPKGYTVPAYAPWRQLTRGNGPVVIVVGPLELISTLSNACLRKLAPISG